MPLPSHALTLQQPWASALFYGRPVESRIRKDGRCPYPQIRPGRLAIHAGVQVHPWVDLAYRSLPALPPLELLPVGAIVGEIDVLGWYTAEQALRDPALAPWVIPGDPNRWYLRHAPERAQLYAEPIPCLGAQGVWSVERRLALSASS